MQLKMGDRMWMIYMGKERKEGGGIIELKGVTERADFW